MASTSAAFACCMALLCPLLLLAGAIPKGELVEWDLDLLQAANANKNAECEHVGILDPPGHHAGYFSIDGTEDGHLFYMYFENRDNDPDAPLVFWTNGGPGCSAMYGLFLENGPYVIQDDLTLCWREHGWDVGHNIVFVDQPIGVGFSYSYESEDKVYTEERVGHDMVQFFYAFLKEHPELAEKDLYITGQSFGGHYLPAIAKAILVANKDQTETQLKLKGVFMLAPWTSPTHHFLSDPKYAFQEGLIDEETKDSMLEEWAMCDNALTMCDSTLSDSTLSDSTPFSQGEVICRIADRFCQMSLFNPVRDLNPSLNYYDIRRDDCDVDGCYDVTKLTSFLNSESVKEDLGAEMQITWQYYRKGTVRQDLAWDVATSAVSSVSSILNDGGVSLTVAVGDQDFICNYMGNEQWVDDMEWNKSDEWEAAEKMQLVMEGKDVGYYREAAPLAFVKVKQAGHMMPMDQPAVMHTLLMAFTRGKSYADVSEEPLEAPQSLPVT